MVIQAFNIWIQKKSNAWNLGILKESSVSIDKYISLTKDLDTRKEMIASVLSKESNIILELEKTTNEKLAFQTTVNDLRNELNKKDMELKTSQPITEPDILKGYWTSTYTFENGQKGDEKIFIDGTSYYLISPENKKTFCAWIKRFSYNERTNEVFFIKEMQSVLNENNSNAKERKVKFLVNELKYYPTEGSIEGIEDGGIKIKYTPIK